MYLVSKHYTETDAKESLVSALNDIFIHIKKEPIIICIGSDRHILDCFGPLTGTMIKEHASDFLVFGTLDEPLHAKNLYQEMQYIKQNYSDYMVIALDASLGSPEDIGMIKLKQGSLLPGKALAKRLPPVGQLSLIGIVGDRLDNKNAGGIKEGSLTHVYHMAKIVSEAIVIWNNQRLEK